MSRYLKQVVVARKDLSMPTGKLAAMVAHASMSFIMNRLKPYNKVTDKENNVIEYSGVAFTPDEDQWLTELDPGIEKTGQVSMAKIVCQVNDESALLAVEQAALDAGLVVHRVIDSGYAHNKPGTFVCIAIGPHWPEQLDPVTGGLKIYR